ncbi:MAG: M23 family metallopeptidase [Actinomycetes bacterium]
MQRTRVVLRVVDRAVESARAQMVVTGVDGDAVEPGLHAEVVAGRQLPESLEEDFLSDVARVLAALHDPQGQIEDAFAVGLVEGLERVPPAGPEARDEAALRIREVIEAEAPGISNWYDARHATYDIGIPAQGCTSACCSKDTAVEAETLSACDESSPDVRSSGMHSSPGNQRRRARERRRNHIRRRRAIALAVFVSLIILAVWAAYAIPGATPARVPQGASRSAFDQAPAGTADIVVASVGGIDILLPVARAATTAVAFHPVENAGTVAFTPVGDGAGGGTAKYYLMSGNGADRSAATAGLDVGAVPGSAVVSPVDGKVTAVKQYQLLGRYADTEIDIQITGDPSLLLVMTHLARVKVHIGDSVIRGDTTLGAVRGFPTGLEQALSQYTSDAGDHVQLVVLRVSSQLAGF